jgi:hypothetical protein
MTHVKEIDELAHQWDGRAIFNSASIFDSSTLPLCSSFGERLQFAFVGGRIYQSHLGGYTPVISLASRMYEREHGRGHWPKSQVYARERQLELPFSGETDLAGG